MKFQPATASKTTKFDFISEKSTLPNNDLHNNYYQKQAKRYKNEANFYQNKANHYRYQSKYYQSQAKKGLILAQKGEKLIDELEKISLYACIAFSLT